MDDIEQRLKDATDVCLKCHAEWDKNKKDGKTREGLMEAVHELRKVAARLEIEIAISERDEMASKPIPIPAHRSNKRRQSENNGEDNLGNVDAGQPSQSSHQHSGGRLQHSGGGGHGGGGRPPLRRRSSSGGETPQGGQE